MKILNLYAGIGGNRKKWNGEKHHITAVEINEEIAQVYKDHFPNDEVVIGDAHEYLKENFQEYDFIWSSPPCPTHSRMQMVQVASDNSYNKDRKAKYPDMKLYQEILLLKHFFEGDWVVENVKSWYDPLVRPQESSRHYFWSNFTIPDIEVDRSGVDEHAGLDYWQDLYGFDLSDYSFETIRKDKVLKNCVHPRIGKNILKARNSRQQTLNEVEA